MKYRKKPVVVEAFQMTNDIYMNSDSWPDWIKEQWVGGGNTSGDIRGTQGNLFIRTLEGVMAVNFGDYIIQGITGELYPCKPDIFEQTYSPAEDKLAVRKGFRHIDGDEIPYWVVQNKYGEILAHCEEEHIAEHFAQRGDLPDA